MRTEDKSSITGATEDKSAFQRYKSATAECAEVAEILLTSVSRSVFSVISVVELRNRLFTGRG